MKFEQDSHLDKLIKRVRREHYPNLKGAQIIGILKGSEVGQQITETPEGKRRKVTQVSKPPELQRFLHGQEFIIQVDRTVWDLLELESQEAHIDEALARCGMGEKGPYIIDPDVEMFAEVIARRGFYTTELEATRDQIAQLQLDFSGKKNRKKSASVH